MEHDIIFEVMPCSKSSSESYAKKSMDKILEAIDGLDRLSMLNIPEIVEENHIGKPYYRNIDVRKFGKDLRQKCNKEIMVNTVVVHHDSREKFEEWLDEAINSYGIKNFVFVGAKMPLIKYPGPSVPEANIIARSRNVNFGNIFIPDRPGEAERLIGKTKTGCNFFTSQVVFELSKPLRVISDYLEKCRTEGLKPSKFYLSFAPVSMEEDMLFLKWLGANTGKETENRLRHAPDMGAESISLLLELMQDVLEFNKKKNVEVGLNIEYIMLHNLEPARELVCKFSEMNYHLQT